MAIVEAVNLAGGEAEYRIARVDEFTERLRAETGEDWSQDYLPSDFTYSHAEVVGVWPNGEPMVLYSGFTNPAQ